MFKTRNKTYTTPCCANNNNNNLIPRLLKKLFMIKYKINANHWISYENGTSAIGCTSHGQMYYKNVQNSLKYLNLL